MNYKGCGQRAEENILKIFSQKSSLFIFSIRIVMVAKLSIRWSGYLARTWKMRNLFNFSWGGEPEFLRPTHNYEDIKLRH
jgi:hypothetical protein